MSAIDGIGLLGSGLGYRRELRQGILRAREAALDDLCLGLIDHDLTPSEDPADKAIRLPTTATAPGGATDLVRVGPGNGALVFGDGRPEGWGGIKRAGVAGC